MQSSQTAPKGVATSVLYVTLRDPTASSPDWTDLFLSEWRHAGRATVLSAKSTAKLSVEPKELGEIKPDGNPEKGRVRIHWESADGVGPGKWSSAMPEPMAVNALDREARQQPPKFVKPQVYDLVKANLP